LVLSTKRLVEAANFLVAATKILFVVPNFVAVTKPFFFRERNPYDQIRIRFYSIISVSQNCLWFAAGITAKRKQIGNRMKRGSVIIRVVL